MSKSTQEPFSPAKITRPLPPPGTVCRARLHGWLDKTESPVVWIVGPPGAGKTTLVSAYIEHAGLTCLWYQIDAGDADPATFFHYMGLAAKKTAPRVKRELPHLTPEFLYSLSHFSRRYFEDLYGRFKGASVVVLDNYQDVGDEAALHSILANAIAALPRGVRIIVNSRVPPPAALARWQANRLLAVLDWDAIRLNDEELCEIARARHPGLSERTIAHLIAQTQGWAAGLVLALECEQDVDRTGQELIAPQLVFDYFAEEIFAGMDAQAQHILLQCAFLPHVNASQAVELTGIAGAGHLFSTLHSRGYFTLKHANAGYQLHPLFRAFLLARAQRSYDEAALNQIRRRAAILLDACGEVAEGVELLLAAADWEAAAMAIARHAPALLQQGRAQTVEKWIRSLPAPLLERNPWCRFYLGLCRLPINPVDARHHFEAAFDFFNARDDRAGAMLAWASIVDSFIFEWGEFEQLDRWIAVMDDMLAQQGPALPPEIAARVACGMFAALVWRQPQRADLPEWAERVMRIVVESDSVALKMALGGVLVLYLVLMQDFAKATVVIDALRSATHARDNTPLTQIQWWMTVAMYAWFADDHAACLAAIDKGAALADATGVHLLSANLFAQGVYSGVSHGDAATAASMLEKMGAAGFPRRLDKALYHYQCASVHWQLADFQRSREHSAIALGLASGVGAPMPLALTRLEYAITLSELGEQTAALAELECGLEAGRGMNHIEFMYYVYGAHIALRIGDRERALELLRTGLAIGARVGYVNMPRWNPAMMAPLCALALEHGIEIDYVRMLVRRRLAGEGAGVRTEAWPWGVRIFTLGEFGVEVDDEPLELATRDRKRPSDLLKVIIALGGRRVNVNSITDLLWPDAEGDAAYQALHTNLHRLRRLLGKDVLRTDAGCITLDDRQVWVDVWALGELLARLESSLEHESSAATASVLNDAQELMKRYKGPFLAEAGEEWWAFVERDRLRARMARVFDRIALQLEGAGSWSSAATIYEWALDVLDPCQESFYMGAMRAHHQLGNGARVMRLYQRCHGTLAAMLEAVPSPAMEDLYASLQGHALGGNVRRNSSL